MLVKPPEGYTSSCDDPISLGIAPRACTILNRKALGIKLKVLGPERPNVAEPYHGTAYKRQDTHEEALRNYRQALQIKQKAFGNVQADVACNKHHIGLILTETGKKASEARAMIAETASRCLVLGPDHLFTKESQRGGE